MGPDFNRLWAGQTVSLIGSEITLVAMPLLAVQRLHASALQLGVVNAARTAPYLVLALAIGLVVDRRRRRPLLIGSNLASTAVLLLVPILAALHRLTIPRLVAIALVAGALQVVFELAYRAYVPFLVDASSLTKANSRLTASESIAEIGGPGVGGLLVQVFGAPVAILADALSFLAPAAGIRAIRAREPEPDVRRSGSIRTDLLEGFGLTIGNRYLRAFLGEAATYNLCWQASITLLVAFAVRDLGMGAGELGLVLAIGSVGALAGAVLTAGVARRIGIGRTTITASVLGNVAPVAIPLLHHGAAPVLAAALFVRGIGMTGCNVHVVSIRQVVTPTNLLGRAGAAYRSIASGALPVGAVLGGVLGEALGLRTALWVTTLTLLTTSLWLVLSPVRTLHDRDLARLTHSPPEPAGSAVRDAAL